jgi:hypothetical protein
MFLAVPPPEASMASGLTPRAAGEQPDFHADRQMCDR